jgi:pimeloyl-ACP methyl ester carboxylesterase
MTKQSGTLTKVIAVALLALALGLVVVTRAIGSTTDHSPLATAEPEAERVQPIAWSECADGAEGWQCATLAVPIDYAQPDGPTVDLALTRLPASDPARRIGPLVLNFGGPGGPAVGTLHEAGKLFFSEELRARFDLVGFDPRGVGQSAQLDCQADVESFYAADPSPDAPAERQTLAEAARRFAGACAANGGSLLAQMGTDNVVRDLEQLRLALDVEQFSFWGPSYGTSIGVQYAEQYPTHVRAFSIEDVLANDLDGRTFVKEVAVGFEQAFDAFLADCAASPECPLAAGGDPGAAFDALMARLDQSPLVAPGDPRPVGQGDILGLVYGGVTRLSSWPDLAALLAAAAAGDAATLRTVVDSVQGRHPDGTFEPPYGTYSFLAVSCLDQSFPRSVEAYEALAAETIALAPRTGAYYLSAGYPCVFWPAPSRSLPASPTGQGAPPLLVVGGTLDNQTPYIWAERLAGQLEGAVLLTREGSGHTSYFLSRCVAETVDAYLLELRLPAPGTRCDSTGGIWSLPDSGP